MITHRELAPLRLKDFLPQTDQIEEVDGWEFMDKVWLGEVYGFTEWLRLREDPEVLRSVSLDLADLDQEVADLILSTLQLSLEYGMELEEVNGVLGEPAGQVQMVTNRTTYEYLAGNREKYYISATIDRLDGLVYLVVIAKAE
jgi:NTP pyrophosphatase (non-canonical NTP hydrolase)